MANLKEFISEAASRCNDLSFKEFSKGAYYNALYRANREIARKYHIFRKILEFKLSDKSSDYSKDIVIDIPDLQDVILVNVNGVNLRKKDHQLISGIDSFSYYLVKSEDGLYLFNYQMGVVITEETVYVNPDIREYVNTSVVERDAEDESQIKYGKNAADKITIVYQAMPDRDSDESEFEIPTRWEEEQLDRAVVHIAKLGIAKFTEEKLEKYTRLFRLYSDNSDFNKEFNETKEAIRIQPFQYP